MSKLRHQTPERKKENDYRSIEEKEDKGRNNPGDHNGNVSTEAINFWNPEFLGGHTATLTMLRTLW